MGSGRRWITAAEARGLRVYRWAPRPVPEGESPVDIAGLKGVPPSSTDSGPSAGDRLAESRVAVAGLGAVGGDVFCGLARLGVGCLLGVDPDQYGPDSYLTQPMRHRDTGRSKAWVQGERAFAANPYTRITAVQGFAQDLPLGALRRASLLVAAGDNAALPVRLGQIAAGLGIPMLQGAVFGEQWLALVRSYGLGDTESPCPSCHLTSTERATAGHRVGCDPQRIDDSGPRTVTLPMVCSTAAQLALGESLKWLLEMENGRLCGEELAYCLLTHRTLRTRHTRNPNCLHRRWRLVDVPEELETTTLATLTGLVPERAGEASVLQVRGELPFASFTFCGACQRRVPVRRFARAGAPLGDCRCGAPLTALPQGLRSVVPQEDLRRCREVSLAELGVGPGEAIGMSWAEEWTYFFIGETEADGRSAAAGLLPVGALAREEEGGSR